MLVHRITRGAIARATTLLVRCKHGREQSSDRVMPEKQRSVRVAFIGEPNSGKSTLINQFLEQHISTVTPHANTTSRNIIGVTTDGETQVVILDTPGMPYYPGLQLEKMKALHETYLMPLKHALTSVDLIVYVADCTVQLSRSYINSALREMIQSYNVPKLLVLNKLDCINEKAKIKQLKKQYTQPLIAKGSLPNPIAERTDITPPILMKLKYSDGIRFKQVFAVSALNGTNVEHLRQAIQDHSILRHWDYPSDEVCPDSLEDVVSDMFREMMLERLEGAAPHLVKQSVIYVREEGNTVIIGHQSTSPVRIFRDHEDCDTVRDHMTKALSDRFGINVELRLQYDRVDKSRPLAETEDELF